MLECFSFFGYNVLETITEIKMDCIYNDDDKKLMKLAAQAKTNPAFRNLLILPSLPVITGWGLQIARACRSMPTSLKPF